MACVDDTIPRPVDEVLFLKSFRRAITVIGIGATRIRWERRITKKRTYEKVVYRLRLVPVGRLSPVLDNSCRTYNRCHLLP